MIIVMHSCSRLPYAGLYYLSKMDDWPEMIEDEFTLKGKLELVPST